MSKAKNNPSSCTPKVLDEETSARVLAEYLVLENVKESEINSLEKKGHALSYREIALAFRVSEILSIRDPFTMAPRFARAFATQRALMRLIDGEESAKTNAPEARP
jgi:hypothetical protein